MLRLLVACLLFACSWPQSAQAQTASEALDASWASACASATPGSKFFDRCQEILNAGPGSDARRSAAALGNNLEIFASQGRLMMALAKSRGRAVARMAGKDGPVATGANFGPALSQDDGKQAGLFAEGSRWSVLGSFSSSNGDGADTRFERGYDDSAQSLLLGLDYRWNNHWTGMLAAQRESREIDFARVSGGMEADTDTVSAVLSYTGDKSFAASLALSAGRLESTLLREIAYTLTLDAGLPTERRVTIVSRGASQNAASIRGAELNVGWERGVSAWTFRYGADLSWQDTQVDRIEENNDVGLDFLVLAQQVKSLQAGIGFDAARAFSTSYGVWQPYVRLRWRHEFADDPRRVFLKFRGGDDVFRLSFLTGEPDRSVGEIGLGVVGVFPHGWQAYAGWQRSVGNSLLVENRVDIGWRREF